MRSNRRYVIWGIIGLVAAVLLVSSRIAYYYTEILWFAELDLQSIFFTVLSTRYIVGLVAGLLFGGFVYLNLRMVRGIIAQLSDSS